MPAFIRTYPIAPHLYKMTVIQLFTVSPGRHATGHVSFGVFPFPASSTAPVTSYAVLLKNATSICYFIQYNTLFRFCQLKNRLRFRKNLHLWLQSKNTLSPRLVKDDPRHASTSFKRAANAGYPFIRNNQSYQIPQITPWRASCRLIA